MKTRTGTCEGCGKRRKLTYPENKTQEVMYHQDGRKKLLSPAEHQAATKQLIHYYGLCSECFPKVNHQDDIIKLRKQREEKPRAEKARFAYPIIGGPLDGMYATTSDFEERVVAKHDSFKYGTKEIQYKAGHIFREGGMYGHLANEYEEFNASRGVRKKLGASPSMVYIHKTLLKPLIHPRDR